MASKTVRRGGWTRDAVCALGLTTDVATAASILGIGRSKAYELARTSEFPVNVLRIGRRLGVPTIALLALLEASASDDASDRSASVAWSGVATSGHVPTQRESSSEVLRALHEADELDRDILMLIGYIVATGTTGHAVAQLVSAVDRVGIPGRRR